MRSDAGASVGSCETPEAFVEALRRSMSEAHTIESLYDGWEQNIEVLRAIHRTTAGRSSVVPDMVAHLRACAVALVKKASEQHKSRSLAGNGRCGDRQRIDKSVLLLCEPRRIRCKDHLRFVASQPCLICGRAPSHAHHIRYAQPRGLGLKVSDEFTVPLCAIHHGQIHETGKETEWWQKRNIDPLKAAADLWRDSRRAQSNLAKIGSSASAKLECHVAPADGADPTAASSEGSPH